MMKKFALLTLLVLPLMGVAHARDRDDNGFTPRDPVASRPGQREWAWDGGDKLALEAPVTLHYSPDGPARVIATGPDEMLNHLRFGQGRIRADNDWNFLRDGGRVTVTVTGVTADKFSLAGSGSATLDGLKLDGLRLSLAGSGSVTGTGRAARVELSIAGSGSADLAHLVTQRANISIAGSGDVMLSPRDEAYVSITGSGAVHMAARPAHFDQKLVGSGAVRFGN